MVGEERYSKDGGGMGHTGGLLRHVPSGDGFGEVLN